MLMQLRRARTLTSLLSSLVAIALICTGMPRASAQVEAARAAEIGEQIRASLQAIEDSARDAPRDRWDPEYVVDQVGLEPAGLLEWVQANVRWVPYSGALRGPQGVLMDRVGNSLDQSLLLSALLNQAGVQTRLARATLRGEVLDDLWAQLTAPPEENAAGDDAGAPDLVQATDDDSFAATAELYGIDPSRVAARYTELATQSTAAAALLGARIARQAPELAALADVAPAGNGAALLAAQKQTLADHWWVQASVGGRWIDLDVLGNEAGEPAAATATETLDPARLPDALEHSVTIRIVAEQLKDGRLTEHVPLEQALRPRDLIGQRVHFLHVPVKWPADWPEASPDTVQVKLRAALYTQNEWLPALVIGTEAMRRASILATGGLNENPSPGSPFQNMTISMVGAIRKAADVLVTGADDTALIEGIEGDEGPRPPNPEGELTAEWLEFVITRPGAAERIVRREVFDLIGPAARARGEIGEFQMSEAAELARATALLGESWIEIMPAKTASEFFLHLASENAVANKPLLEDMASDPFSKLPANYTETLAKLTPFPATVHMFAMLRFASPVGELVFLDRPTIVAQHTTLSRGGGGDFVPRTAIDIIENGVGVEPFVAGNAVTIRLAQGVADTNAESLAVAQPGMATANTADAFAAPGTQWTSIAPGDAAALAALDLPADLSARIAADLSAGLTAVVPRDPAVAQTAGWWRIDTRDGTTLGVAPNGHGAAMVEYAFVLLMQGVLAAAVCMVQEAGVRAIEREVSGTDVARQVLGAAGSAFTKANTFRCGMTGVGAMLQMATMGASMSVLQARMLSRQTASSKPAARSAGGTVARSNRPGSPNPAAPGSAGGGGRGPGGPAGPAPAGARNAQSGRTQPVQGAQAPRNQPGRPPSTPREELPPTQRAPGPTRDQVRQAYDNERRAMGELKSARDRNAPAAEIERLRNDAAKAYEEANRRGMDYLASDAPDYLDIRRYRSAALAPAGSLPGSNPAASPLASTGGAGSAPPASPLASTGGAPGAFSGFDTGALPAPGPQQAGMIALSETLLGLGKP